jgi:hypothetical protein
MYFHHHLLYEPKIIDSIFGISGTLWGVIGALFIGILALFGDQIKKFLFKPEIEGIEFKKTFQQVRDEIYIYHRLIVKNIGYVVAKEVRVLLTYLDASQAENFIPAPLNWTHWNTRTRDISRGEPAYIDILVKINTREPYRFCWSYEVGTPYESDLIFFDISKGNLRLEFYELDSKVGDIVLNYSEKEDRLVIIKK